MYDSDAEQRGEESTPHQAEKFVHRVVLAGLRRRQLLVLKRSGKWQGNARKTASVVQFLADLREATPAIGALVIDGSLARRRAQLQERILKTVDRLDESIAEIAKTERELIEQFDSHGPPGAPGGLPATPSAAAERLRELCDEELNTAYQSFAAGSPDKEELAAIEGDRLKVAILEGWMDELWALRDHRLWRARDLVDPRRDAQLDQLLDGIERELPLVQGWVLAGLGQQTTTSGGRRSQAKVVRDQLARVMRVLTWLLERVRCELKVGRQLAMAADKLRAVFAARDPRIKQYHAWTVVEWDERIELVGPENRFCGHRADLSVYAERFRFRYGW